MARDSRVNGSTTGGVRLYTPSSGSLAYRSDYAYRTAQLAPSPRRRPQTEPSRQDVRSRPERERFSLAEYIRQNRVVPKAFSLLCIAAVAFVAMFVFFRFAGIARLQASINKLNSEIEATQRAIDGLNFENQPSINTTNFAESVGLMPAKP